MVWRGWLVLSQVSARMFVIVGCGFFFAPTEPSKRPRPALASPTAVTVSVTPHLTHKHMSELLPLTQENHNAFPAGRWAHSFVAVNDKRAILYGGEKEAVDDDGGEGCRSDHGTS